MQPSVARASKGSARVTVAAYDAPVSVRVRADYRAGSANAHTDINNALAAGRPIDLTEGTFNLGGAVLLNSYNRLAGAGSLATVLKLAGGVSGATNAMQLASARVEHTVVSDLEIDGNFVGQHGIYILNDSFTNGAFASGLNNPRHTFTDLLIRNAGADGLHLDGDAYGGACATDGVQVYFAAGYGIYTVTPDSVFANCDVGQAGLDGYRDRAGNNRYVGCKAWLSGRVTTTSAGFSARSRTTFIGCDAQDNAKDGVDFFNAINCSFQGLTDTNGKRNGSGVGVNAQGATACSIDITSLDRKGDAGTDPFYQNYAVDLTSATKNVVRVSAGAHGVAAIPNAQLSSDNTILVQALGSSVINRVPITAVSVIDSLNAATGSTVRAETMHSDISQGSVTPANGVPLLSYFVAPASIVATKIGIKSRGTAQAGATLVRYGLYLENADGSLTLVARTATSTSFLNSTFNYTERAFDTTGGYPASYTLTPGQRYAVGLIIVGTTTAPALYGAAVAGQEISPTKAATVTSGQTDLPTAINAVGGASPAITTTGNRMYATVGP